MTPKPISLIEIAYRTHLVVFFLLALVFAVGCDQPPKLDTAPEPVSVTAPIGEALADVDAIPPLATNIRDDAKALTPANVPTLAPRIERNADEVIDHARAASAKLTATESTARENDKRVEALIASATKLQSDNAALKEAIEREKRAASRTMQTIVSGVGAVCILAGIAFGVSGNVKNGVMLGAAGAVAIGLATFWLEVALIGLWTAGIALVGGVAWFAWNAWRNRKSLDQTIADAKSLVVANIAAIKQGALFPTQQLASVWKWEQTPGARKLVDEVQAAEGVGKLAK